MLKKGDFEKQGCQVVQNEKYREKIGFAFSTLAEWWKWKMLHWLTMRHCV